jgi:hypothetical protein
MRYSRDTNYEENSKIITLYYPDGGIKCKNYTLCNSVLPTWWWECKRSYLCFMCETMKCGILNFKYTEDKCKMCDTMSKESVIGVNCNHDLCIPCMKKILHRQLKSCPLCKK